MAAANPALTGMWMPVAGVSAAVRSRSWSGTPEIYFDKQIDNSRLVKVADGQRNRELGMFVTSVAGVFLFVVGVGGGAFCARGGGFKDEMLEASPAAVRESGTGIAL